MPGCLLPLASYRITTTTFHRSRGRLPKASLADIEYIMKAVYFEKHGPPSVLQYAEEFRHHRPDDDGVPSSSPSKLQKDELAVEIYAASINAADWKVRSGTVAGAPSLKFPHVLGRDFSGKVLAVGSSSEERDPAFKVGDDVFGVLDVGQEGTYCERLVVKEYLCCRKPKSVGHVEICSLALTGLTAVVTLEDELKVQKGERVLITGGAGGVGSAAIQIAKHRCGASEVVTTTSTDNVEYVQGLGADRVIDYRIQPDFSAALKKQNSKGEDGDSRNGSEEELVDAVFDTVGGEDIARYGFAALKPGGRAAFIASGKTAPASPDPSKYKSIRPGVGRHRRHLQRIADLVEKGQLRPPPIRIFQLKEAVQAHELSESRHFRGKLVFRVKDEGGEENAK